MGTSGFTLADHNRSTIVDSTGLSGTFTPDLLTVDANNPVTVLVFTGTMPSNVTIAQPLNAPTIETCSYLFVNPGTNTPTFSGYKNFTNLPVWEAGKDAFYTFQRVPVNATPSQDSYILSGGVEGGLASAPTGVVDLPPIGTEVAYRNHPTFGQTFLQVWEGTFTTSPEALGGAITGVMERLIDKGGDLRPSVASGNNVQRWGIPYHFVPADLQMSSNILRLVGDAALIAAVPTFSVWAEYTKQ